MVSLLRRHALKPRFASHPRINVDLKPRDPLSNGRRVDQPMPQHLADERDILVATCRKLRGSKIMRLETESGRASGRRGSDADEALLPSQGQRGRFDRDAVRVIAERDVKGRALANGAVNEICIRRRAQREDVQLHRLAKRGRHIWNPRQEAPATR